MSLELDINDVVERLEASWMPRLSDFGRSLALSHPHIVAKTFSNRHAEVVHNLGISCYPAGSDSSDPRAVALVVTVTAVSEPSLRGYVTWQAPSLHQEGETAFYDPFEPTDLARFNEELQGLFSVLSATVERGAPPAAAPTRNHPMQGTGAAGLFSRIRKWFGRRRDAGSAVR